MTSGGRETDVDGGVVTDGGGVTTGTLTGTYGVFRGDVEGSQVPGT